MAQGDIESGKGMNQEYGVKRPCDNRWGSHYGSLLNIKKIYSLICEVLQDLNVDSSDQDNRAESLRVLRKIKTFEFVFLRTSKERLQDIRNGGWEPLMKKVALFCDKYVCEFIDMNGAYFDGISHRIGSKVDYFHHYQVDVLYLVIDMQLQELNHHFNEVNMRLLICMSSLCPSKSFEAFKVDDLIELATFYLDEFPTPYDSLELELKRYIMDVSGDKEFAILKDIKYLCKKMVETKKMKSTQMYIFSSN
ncbi:zinc finger MYM-type protein 1-like protein [Tanacetum coccineum]